MSMQHEQFGELAGRSGSAAVPAKADRLGIWALAAGLLAGAGSWGVGEATINAFPPKLERMMTPVGPLMGTRATEQVKADTKNAALAFAVQAACLGMALGLAGGLARRSLGGGAMAGLAGAVLGGALALGAAAALQPVYYRNVQLDQIEQSLIVPLLVHGGICGVTGLAGGLAFGLGLKGRWSLIARSAAGGLVGALLATFAFEVAGAMLFPEAKTTRPLSLSWESRLMARMLVGLLSAAGALAVVAGQPVVPRRPELEANSPPS
jgi:hypothetical protein